MRREGVVGFNDRNLEVTDEDPQNVGVDQTQGFWSSVGFALE